jgi:hypothetical protein
MSLLNKYVKQLRSFVFTLYIQNIWLQYIKEFKKMISSDISKHGRDLAMFVCKPETAYFDCGHTH